VRGHYTCGMDPARLFAQSVDYSPSSDWMVKVPGRGGVYLLADEQNRVIQLATTADLKRALRHRLGTARNPDPEIDAEASQIESIAANGAKSNDNLLADASAFDSLRRDEPGSQGPRRRRADLREIVRRIWWRPADSQFELTFVFYHLARVLMPQTYR